MLGEILNDQKRLDSIRFISTIDTSIFLTDNQLENTFGSRD